MTASFVRHRRLYDVDINSVFIVLRSRWENIDCAVDAKMLHVTPPASITHIIQISQAVSHRAHPPRISTPNEPFVSQR